MESAPLKKKNPKQNWCVDWLVTESACVTQLYALQMTYPIPAIVDCVMVDITYTLSPCLCFQATLGKYLSWRRWARQWQR